MSKRNKCSACGRKWTEHPGIIPTCAALQAALDVLHQIASAPRNRGDRNHARSAVIFLETQI